MKAGKTNKTVYYRRFKIDVKPAQNLQQLLGQALTQERKVKNRLEALGSASTEFRVIGEAVQKGAFLCGSLLTFERGSYQTVINDDPEATTLSMDALPPPLKGKVQQQFLAGALYFAVFENHVAVIQSAALKANAFEQHLAWLLRSKTNLVDQTVPFVLSDEPQKVTRERIRKSHVKAISFGKPFMSESVALQPAQKGAADQRDKKVKTFTPDPSILGVIGNFLKKDELSDLGLEAGVFDSNLEIWLEIRYPKHQRSRPLQAAKLMDNLSIALRNQDEESVELTLADGSTVKGKELKISNNLEAKISNGIIQTSALYDDMAAWVAKLIKDGMVS